MSFKEQSLSVEPLVNGHLVHPPFVGDTRPPSGKSVILLLCGSITIDSTVKATGAERQRGASSTKI
jgi:hypothetical protein